MSIATQKDKLFLINKTKLQSILNKVTNRLNIQLGKQIANLQRIDGRILNNTYNLNYILDMTQKLQLLLSQSGIQQLYNEFNNTTLLVYKQLKDKVIKGGGLPLLLNQTSNEYFKAILRKDLTQLKGLSLNTLDKIRDVFIQSAIFQMTDKQLTSRIVNVVQKNLVNYSKTYMETSRGLFIQNTIDKNYQMIKQQGDKDEYIFQYVGAEDDNVRQVCQIGLNKQYFTQQQKTLFQSTYGTRYNCRHSFVLINKSTIKKE